jgi:hypothetical protein
MMNILQLFTGTTRTTETKITKIYKILQEIVQHLDLPEEEQEDQEEDPDDPDDPEDPEDQNDPDHRNIIPIDVSGSELSGWSIYGNLIQDTEDPSRKLFLTDHRNSMRFLLEFVPVDMALLQSGGNSSNVLRLQGRIRYKDERGSYHHAISEFFNVNGVPVIESSSSLHCSIPYITEEERKEIQTFTRLLRETLRGDFSNVLRSMISSSDPAVNILFFDDMRRLRERQDEPRLTAEEIKTNLDKAVKKSQKEEQKRQEERQYTESKKEKCFPMNEKCVYTPLDMEDWCEHEEEFYYGPDEDRRCFDLFELLTHFENQLGSEINGNPFPQYPSDPFNRQLFSYEELLDIAMSVSGTRTMKEEDFPKFVTFMTFLSKLPFEKLEAMDGKPFTKEIRESLHQSFL